MRYNDVYMEKLKILITGGHFTPAKAVIEELLKNKNVEIVYVGRKTSMEGDSALSTEPIALSKLKIKYKTLITGRLRRSFDFLTIFSLLKIPIGIFQSILILLSERPDIILSFGGYISVPLVITGWLLSIPIITHEQGLTLGLANKINSLFADKVALSFPNNSANRKIIVTGNPLRDEILNAKKLDGEYKEIFNQSRKLKLPVILITGGNQGSHVINLAVEGCLQNLLKVAYIIHQTGESKYNDFERLKISKNGRYLPIKWIGDGIGGLLANVNLVVCRSGMNTLMEAAFIGIPLLTIPINKHYEQNQNAQFFQKIGLGSVLLPTKLSPKSLEGEIKRMIKNIQNLRQKARKAKLQIIPDASKRLALETILLAKQSIL